MRGFTLAVAAGIALTLTGGQSAQGLDWSGLCGSGLCGSGLCGSGLCGSGLCGSGFCDGGGHCDSACCDTNCGESGCCDAMSGCDQCGVCGQSGLGCDCLGRMKLLGCIKPSDRCFDDFISPMINFVFFEDPRTVSELRPIFVTHNVPDSLGGGSIQLYAMQFRIALTDRLSLIAVKDGYIVDNTDADPIDGLLADGWANVTVGLKYNLLRDTCRGRLFSVGATYEIPMGSRDALQDIADGQFYFFGTGGQRLWDGNAHFLTSFGWRLPVDGSLQTESLNWSNHFDVRVTDTVYLLTEFSWWHWTDSAENGLALGVAGQDLFNLPSNNVSGNDLVTQNVGLKYKPNRKVEAGLAYQFPLTGFKDVIEDRLQVDLIFRY